MRDESCEKRFITVKRINKCQVLLDAGAAEREMINDA